MLELHPIQDQDVTVIRSWPSYPPEFAELDYALRVGGWLAEYLQKPGTWIYVAKQYEEIAAFTILSKTGEASAEFRIALRPDKLGQGLGKIIACMTLCKGFAEIGLSCIHLIVRKNNTRAIHLYQNLGFREAGMALKEVNGKQVEFLAMEISKTSCAQADSLDAHKKTRQSRASLATQKPV